MFVFIKQFFSPWTITALVVSAGITLGVHRAASDLATTVFTAQATFVALVVPAAALANGLLEGRLLSYLGQLGDLPAGTDPATAATKLGELADQVVSAIKPLAQGFAFLLLGFGLSIGAMFHPDHPIWKGTGWWKVNVEDMLVGGAIGFDVVAALLFLPFVWLLLDQKLAASTRDIIKSSASQVSAVARAAPAANKTPSKGAG